MKKLTPKDITLAFVTLERPPFLAESLKSVEGFPNIIVYDNGSKNPANINLAKAWAKRFDCQFIRSETNDGLPKAWNRCIIESKTNWVVLCPDDIIFDPNWLSYVNQVLTERPQTLMLFGNISDIILLHKKVITKFGWLEERYQGGVSSEDYDLHLRLTEIFGFSPYTWPGDHIQGHEREIRIARKTTKEDYFKKHNFTYWCNSEFSSVPLLGKEIPHSKTNHWNAHVEPGNTPGYIFHDTKWKVCSKHDEGALLNIDGQYWKRLIEDVDPYPKITQKYRNQYA